MENQLPLFNRVEPPQPRSPAARSTDPATSHAAAREVTRNGVRDGQARAVLEALRGNPGSTTAELAKLSGLDRHAVARRMPELEKLGLLTRGDARLCRATKRRALTWWPHSRSVSDTSGGG